MEHPVALRRGAAESHRAGHEALHQEAFVRLHVRLERDPARAADAIALLDEPPLRPEVQRVDGDALQRGQRSRRAPIGSRLFALGDEHHRFEAREASTHGGLGGASPEDDLDARSRLRAIRARGGRRRRSARRSRTTIGGGSRRSVRTPPRAQLTLRTSWSSIAPESSSAIVAGRVHRGPRCASFGVGSELRSRRVGSAELRQCVRDPPTTSASRRRRCGPARPLVDVGVQASKAQPDQTRTALVSLEERRTAAAAEHTASCQATTRTGPGDPPPRRSESAPPRRFRSSQTPPPRPSGTACNGSAPSP